MLVNSFTSCLPTEISRHQSGENMSGTECNFPDSDGQLLLVNAVTIRKAESEPARIFYRAGRLEQDRDSM